MSTGVLPLPSSLYEILANGPTGIANQQQAQRAQTALTRSQVPLVQQQATGVGLQNQLILNQLNQARIVQQAIRNLSGPAANPGMTGNAPTGPVQPGAVAPSAPNPNQPYSAVNPRQMVDRTGGQQALPQAPPGFTLDQVPGGTE